VTRQKVCSSAGACCQPALVVTADVQSRSFQKGIFAFPSVRGGIDRLVVSRRWEDVATRRVDSSLRIALVASQLGGIGDVNLINAVAEMIDNPLCAPDRFECQMARPGLGQQPLLGALHAPGVAGERGDRLTRRPIHGFSLVELLIVIGIIAILIGILIPVIGRARAQARIVACRAQMQNLGSAMQMYRNQNKGRFPPAPQVPSADPAVPDLTDYLAPHVGGVVRVFHCPADVDPVTVAGVSYSSFHDAEQTSYAYNVELGVLKVSETLWYQVFHSTNQVPVLWDADNFHGGSLPFNWLFADGHVENFLSKGL